MYTKYIFSIFTLLIQTIIYGQSFCLSLSNPTIVGNELSFDISMAGSAAFQLGSSNLQFGYNASALSNPSIVSHSFTGAYDVPTLTTPLPSQASLNIYLFGQNNGIPIATSSAILARVKFTITNSASMSNLVWSYNGGTTQTVVYNDPQPATRLLATNNNTACLQPLNTSLPLQLLDFKATAKTETIDLEWTTAREDGVSHFDVLRSLDGNTFQDIGRVEAVGDHVRSAYVFTDLAAIKGVQYYYKLKMVDFDGYEEWSPIARAKIQQNGHHVAVYPNPVGKNAEINITADFDESFRFILTDAKGSVVLTKTVQNNTVIRTADLISGMYFYKIENKNFAQSGKIEVVH
ncbi:MAG: T9SS type A sorting domain-containing protein [Saprospiraceae bacterium]